MKIQNNIPLKDKNWFKTGENAMLYCEPQNELQFQQALEFASKNKLKTFVLGCGANVLISDEGFNGLVIKPNMQNITLNNLQETVTAQAGVTMHQLINFCFDNNLIGLEEFSGVPASIGGAVYINIHYFHYFLSDFIIKAKVIDKQTMEIFTVDKNWFNFSYNYSTLCKKEHYLIEATFKLKKVDSFDNAYAKGKSDERKKQREIRYPNKNTCGSFFRNFHEEEINLKINNKKIIYVAYYLDKLGIKGSLCHNKASVSYQHANMIVTQEGATTSDVINLAQKMQSLVFEKYGILPQPECQFVGFSKYPLLLTEQLNTKPHHAESYRDIASSDSP